MVALRSLAPEDRVEILAELHRCEEDCARFEHHLARLTRERAPHAYRGKLKAQIAACQRHETRMRQLLEEVAA